jgi:hypothetical protein
MSQRALETALGKLICDDAFRRQFYQDARGTVLRAGFRLTPVEFSCLHDLDLEALEAFVSRVDERVRRAEEPALDGPLEAGACGPRGAGAR